MRRVMIVVLIAWFGWSGSANANETAPIVVVLSWDGMRHDYADRGDFPALDRLEREGVRAQRLTPVFPSATFPGHVSMATGTYPDRHGIVDNTFIDTERGPYRYAADANWIEAEPVWIAAERQGVSAATYFWVGSESDWHAQRTRYRIAPFDAGRPESVKVDQMLAWLSLPEDERPRLVMSYWAGTDGVGHDHGPDSPRIARQLQGQDAELGRLLAGIDTLGLWPRTTLLLVSDHGMTSAGRYVDVRGALDDAGIEARITGAAVANVYLADASRSSEAGGLLTAVVADVPGAKVYPRAGLPAELRLTHARRTGDWVVIVPPPYVLSRPAGTTGVLNSILYRLGWDFGMHGYDPVLPDMGGAFFAIGRGVDPERAIGEVRQVDVAATICALLGIDPPRDSEGRAIF